jgi:hypothetical protein
VSGQAPGSGAERRGQVLDEVSTAIHGGAAAVNVEFCGPRCLRVSRNVLLAKILIISYDFIQNHKPEKKENAYHHGILSCFINFCQ